MSRLTIWALFTCLKARLAARTRHLDTRFKYVNSLQEQGLIKVDFVRSEENTSDIATKNISVELFNIHIAQLIADKSYVQE